MITVTKDTYSVQNVRLLNTGARWFNDEIAKVYGEQVFFPLWETDKKVMMVQFRNFENNSYVSQTNHPYVLKSQSHLHRSASVSLP